MARMLAALRDWSAGLAAAWSRFQTAEEERFQESIGVEAEPEETVADGEPAAPCSVEEAAPDLVDIIRKRQQAEDPRDFMYGGKNDSGEDG